MGVKILKGRRVKLEVALTYGTSKDVSGITKANPAVLTSTGHGLSANTIAYLSALVGMDELEGRPVSVGDPDTNSFELTGIDTTHYTSAATGGALIPVATWGTVATATSFQISGGDASKIDTTTLADDMRQQENGMLAAQSVSIESFVADGSNAALEFMEKAALDAAYVTFRATWPSGYRVVWRGQVSLPGMNTQMDQAVTGGFNTTVRGSVLKLPV